MSAEDEGEGELGVRAPSRRETRRLELERSVKGKKKRDKPEAEVAVAEGIAPACVMVGHPERKDRRRRKET